MAFGRKMLPTLCTEQRKSQRNKNLGLNFFLTFDLLIMFIMAVGKWKPESKHCWRPYIYFVEHQTEGRMEIRSRVAKRKYPAWFFNFPHHTQKNKVISFKIFYKALKDGSKQKYPSSFSQLVSGNISPRAEECRPSSRATYTPVSLPQAGFSSFLAPSMFSCD